jgi:MFS family permease
MSSPAKPDGSGKPLSPTVRALGAVSLFTDISSEMVYPVTPLLLTQVLRAPAWTVGVIEGIAESTASLLKIYSGWLSDRMGARKPLTLLGYLFGAVSKPFMGIAGSWPQVLGARFLDRTGKGLRTAPRDALIAESSEQDHRGRAFGFHRAMDTTGAVVGPLLGYWYLRTHPQHIRNLYWIAFLPGLLAVLILWLFVKEKRARKVSEPEGVTPPSFSFKGLSPEYRRYLFAIGVFSIGNSSDAFLLMRSADLGVGADSLLLLYALFNTVEAAFSYKAGSVSDRVGRRPMLVAGLVAFALVYLGFAVARGPAWVWPLFVAYGLYYTLTGGVQRAYAADLANPERRGTEIGAFHMLVGLLALPASILAGQLYDHVSQAAPFLLGAVCAGAAALLLLRSGRQVAIPVERKD